MSKTTLFEEVGRASGCCSGDDEECVCGDGERGLRAFMDGRAAAAMTPEQRAWCLTEIGQVEGYDAAGYRDQPDDLLARGVLSAWTDYCRDKGLL